MTNRISKGAKKAIIEVTKLNDEIRIVGSKTSADYYDFLSRIGQLEGNLEEIRALEESRSTVTLEMLQFYRLPVPAEIAVDFGCGDGGSSKVLMQTMKPSKMIMIDGQLGAIEKARERFGQTGNTSLEYFLAKPLDLEGLNFPNADIMLMRSVIRYISNSERQILFNGAYKKLKESGVLIFDTPIKAQGDWQSSDDLLTSYFARVFVEQYGISELRSIAMGNHNPDYLTRVMADELKAAGFKDVKIAEPKRAVTLERAMMIAEDEFERMLMRKLEEIPSYSAKIASEVRHLKGEIMGYINHLLAREFRQGVLPVSYTVFRAQK